MGKILHFSACRGEEYFTAPHNTSRRGGFSFTPAPPLPHRRDKTRPARPHQRPSGKNSPSTLKPPQNQRFFACRANSFSVSPRIHACWTSFFALMGATATSQHPPTTSPETNDTNAGGSLPRDETTDTSASSLPHTFETADTFARMKRPFSGHFPPAKVSRVSWTPRRAPTKASPVSSGVESGLLIRSKVLRRSCLLPPSRSW